MRMYDKIFNFKFLPPGRGLWAMGTPLVSNRKLYNALNNCAFVSTDQEKIPDFIDTFLFLMDCSMLGVGTGFDTKGKNKFKVYKPCIGPETQIFVVPDTREGWVESTKALFETYLVKNSGRISFDYSQIRPAGSPLKTFGGVCSGA